ncbi:MAG: reverse transcriptase family protein [Armatimonadota bacterium]|jgi:RNA-directed DNA polymerase
MGLWNTLRRLFGGGSPGHDLASLAERLGLTVEQLRAVEPRYHSFERRKRSGGTRRIDAPDDRLMGLQRSILRGVLGGLRSHRAAHGFEEGRSIVSNARPHVGKAVVITIDLRDFFAATTDQRVRRYLRFVGWSRSAAAELVRLTTWQGALPQGAPTSPKLSNLVNYRMDARLAGMARAFGGDYTRYADDIAISLVEDRHEQTFTVLRLAGRIVSDSGYEVNADKTQVRRRHQRQEVTGLVVNERIHLPRETRRWLRAVEHRLRIGGECSLSDAELDGWLALTSMVHTQGEGAGVPRA